MNFTEYKIAQEIGLAVGLYKNNKRICQFVSWKGAGEFMDRFEAANKPDHRIYKIWVEGWQGHVAQGEHGTAQFIGKVEADSFADALMKVRYHKNFHYAPLRGTLLSEKNTFSLERLSDWGCRLFDNEQDARVSFG